MTDNTKALVLAALLGLGVLLTSVHDNLPLSVLIAAAALSVVVWAWLKSERDGHDL